MINLNDFLAVGQNAIARRVVQHSDASDNYSNAFKNLLATPRLIHWGIDASIEAIDLIFLMNMRVSVCRSISSIPRPPVWG